MGINNWEFAEALLPAHLFKDGPARFEAVRNVAEALQRRQGHEETMSKLESVRGDFNAVDIKAKPKQWRLW